MHAWQEGSINHSNKTFQAVLTCAVIWLKYFSNNKYWNDWFFLLLGLVALQNEIIIKKYIHPDIMCNVGLTVLYCGINPKHTVKRLMANASNLKVSVTIAVECGEVWWYSNLSVLFWTVCRGLHCPSVRGIEKSWHWICSFSIFIATKQQAKK